MTAETSRNARFARRAFGFVFMAAMAAMTAMASLPVLAEGSSPESGGVPRSPSQIFRTYCASCHGTEGRGDGPIASSLLKKPADLTRIAERSGGVFPKAEVAETIDGRQTVAAHGPREMPVWGDALVWPEEDTPERRAEVKKAIDGLVELLESMQVKSAAKPKS